MSELVERFELAFNQIHQLLKEMNRYPKNDNFVELLQRSKERSVIKEHFDALRQYAKLRNAIVHERVRDGYYIASPHLEVVEELEYIKQTLDQPPKALDIATRPVMFFYADSELLEVMQAFRNHGVSQFPIYAGPGGRFLGLVTDAAVVRWISGHAENGTVAVEGVRVRDVLEHEGGHNVEFIPERATVFDVEDVFEDSHLAGQKLKAVIVTKDGEWDRSPLGIVTTWDLIKVDAEEPEDE
ncbi:HPP family protein [Halobacillus sp. A5]|uniref:CBS domain-containing protein n=1 Tax=Halobacillus sp. A5 TaxID=2880263 RepID=UPI0020A6AB96|nr:CBS domain-containing protein [Halobacillus sp. A5]MCP3029512.1 CBS domain-containing protein [Halobacillus sp. A5]